MREIYLDNCATTRPREEVIEVMMEVLKDDYGNPSSLHRKGLITEKKMDKSRESIGRFLKVDDSEIFFTSGGTESNNIAIQSIVEGNKNRGRHIITTEVEHSSITNIMKHYENKGFEISYLKVDDKGFISLEELEKTLREDTILISIILVNNEIGNIQDIDKVRRIMNKKNSKALLHLDAIQGIGKVPVDIRGWEVDTLSLSGHKIYGPKGIGALYVRKGLNISPIVYGGNQEKGLRSGTENVPGIVGLGKAIDIIEENFDSERKKVKELKKYLLENIEKEIKDIKINSPLDIKSSPYIANISFLNIKSEILLHYLENHDIYISTGSACSKGTTKSNTLIGIGLTDKEIDGAIRVCFSYETEKEDIDRFIEETKVAVEEIREITMR